MHFDELTSCSSVGTFPESQDEASQRKRQGDMLYSSVMPFQLLNHSTNSSFAMETPQNEQLLKKKLTDVPSPKFDGRSASPIQSNLLSTSESQDDEEGQTIYRRHVTQKIDRFLSHASLKQLKYMELFVGKLEQGALNRELLELFLTQSRSIEPQRWDQRPRYNQPLIYKQKRSQTANQRKIQTTTTNYSNPRSKPKFSTFGQMREYYAKQKEKASQRSDKYIFLENERVLTSKQHKQGL